MWNVYGLKTQFSITFVLVGCNVETSFFCACTLCSNNLCNIPIHSRNRIITSLSRSFNQHDSVILVKETHQIVWKVTEPGRAGEWFDPKVLLLLLSLGKIVNPNLLLMVSLVPLVYLRLKHIVQYLG